MLDLHSIENLCIELALQNGRILINEWNNLTASKKPNTDESTTNLDIQVEKNILSKLKKHFPDYNYRGEETDNIKTDSPYTWYIDPIDGTNNYIHKLPIFCISIALAENDLPIFGLVYNPFTHELFYAGRDQGAKLIRTTYDHLVEKEQIIKLQVSKEQKLSSAFLQVELPNKQHAEYEKSFKLFKKLLKNSHKIRCFGSAALSLCYTALGSFDGYIDLSFSARPFDIAAGILIVQEAGGKITDINGNPYNLKNQKLIASNNLIHKDLQACLS